MKPAPRKNIRALGRAVFTGANASRIATDKKPMIAIPRRFKRGILASLRYRNGQSSVGVGPAPVASMTAGPIFCQPSLVIPSTCGRTGANESFT